MNDDELAKLLATADVAPRWTPPQDFATQLRVQSRRRRHRRQVLLAAPVVLALLATAGWLATRDAPIDQVASAPELQPAVADAELDRLLAEADFQDRLARRLLDDWRREQSLAANAGANAGYDAELSAREQVEIVACRMILEAEALLAKMDPDGRATAIYEKVVRLFPETSSAQTARRRLAGRASG
jgi:hypothetical protein